MTAAPRRAEAKSSLTSRKRLASILLRVAVGLLFVAAGSSKLLAPAATTAVVASRNLPVPLVIGTAVGLLEVISGVLLIAAFKVRWVAMGLAALVVVAAALFHFPVVLSGPRAFEIATDVGVLIALYAIATRTDSVDSG